MGYFVLLLLTVLFIVLRVTYIDGIVNDWNYQLESLINKTERTTGNSFQWLHTYDLNRWKYYWRLDVWFIHNMIKNDDLIQQVSNHAQESYFI